MPKTVIEETIEETKEQLKAATEREQKELEEAAKEPEKVEEPVPEEKEKPSEEVKPEEVKPEEEVKTEERKKSPAEIRVEKRNKEKLLAEQVAARDAELAAARARIAELERPAEKAVEVVPDKSEDPVAYAEYVARKAEKTASTALEKLEQLETKQNTQEAQQRTVQLENAAKGELFQMEAKLKSELPDYDDVKNFHVNSLAYAFKKLNPRITDQQLVQAIDAKIYNDAIELYKEGYENPVHALYEQIKANGYAPKSVEKEEKKPDLDKVAKNRARNAGTVGASAGTGQGEVTPRYAATEMTTEEIGKLFATMSPQEKKNFYKQLGG